MRKLAALLVLVILIVGCDSDVKIEKPKNLIPEGEMIDVLSEMFVVNSAKGVNRKLLEINGVSPESYILKKYSIDSTQFAQSNNYYAHNIEIYKKIIEEVKQKIIVDRSIYEAEKEKEDEQTTSMRDSIKKLRKNIKKILPKELKKKIKDTDQEEVIEN